VNVYLITGIRMLSNNFLALLFTFIAALAWLRINDTLAHKGLIDNQLSRKIIHMGTGPIFVLCWLLFPGNPYDRFLAALVPGLITIQFVLVGFGIIKDQAAVQAMSRSGNPKEILRGPLFYGILFVLITVLYWLESPIGIVGLMLMCGGDGLADILGRRYGKTTLPWSGEKTWIGSIGMLTGGWIFAAGIVLVYVLVGIFPGPFNSYLLPVTLIAMIGTLVESLPLRDIDNITVTISAIIVGHLVF
jgi:phytol kinase